MLLSRSIHNWTRPFLWSAQERSVWLRWVLGTLAAFSAGMLLTAQLPPIAAAGVIGLAVGSAQWLAMRRAAWTPMWIAATAAGAIAAALALEAVFQALEAAPAWPVVSFAALYLSAGVCIGAAQWLVLRGRVARAGWWVLASALSYLAGALVLGIGSELLAAEAWANLSLAALLGLVVSALTGAALIWLLRYPRHSARPRPTRPPLSKG